MSFQSSSSLTHMPGNLIMDAAQCAEAAVRTFVKLLKSQAAMENVAGAG